MIAVRLFCALASVLSFVYLVGWLMNRYTVSTIDSGVQLPRAEAALIDIALIGLFGLQHSLMARPWIKRWLGRSSYLLATALVFAILFRYWEPLPHPAWFVSGGAARWALSSFAAASAAFVVWSLATLGPLSFLGLREQRNELCRRGPYACVRHPIVTGTLLALWSTPEMSQGRLLFTAGMTIYAFVGGWLEERSLKREFGAGYERYQAEVPAYIPSFRSYFRRSPIA